jgi:hypothetical protein
VAKDECEKDKLESWEAEKLKAKAESSKVKGKTTLEKMENTIQSSLIRAKRSTFFHQLLESQTSDFKPPPQA